jgi:hypothetical protein
VLLFKNIFRFEGALRPLQFHCDRGVNISRNGHNVYAAGATDIQLELSPLGPAKNQSINPNTGKIRISTTQNTLEALLALLWKTLRIAHTLRTSMIRPKNPPTSMSISAPCLYSFFVIVHRGKSSKSPDQ